jgi:hypothetical protein
LIDGQKCCTNCRAWLIECEARHLLGLLLQKRREQLDARLKPRGAVAVQQLKDKMIEVFDARKKI